MPLVWKFHMCLCRADTPSLRATPLREGIATMAHEKPLWSRNNAVARESSESTQIKDTKLGRSLR
jgi:hypothetical protein